MAKLSMLLTLLLFSCTTPMATAPQALQPSSPSIPAPSPSPSADDAHIGAGIFEVDMFSKPMWWGKYVVYIYQRQVTYVGDMGDSTTDLPFPSEYRVNSDPPLHLTGDPKTRVYIFNGILYHVKTLDDDARQVTSYSSPTEVLSMERVNAKDWEQWLLTKKFPDVDTSTLTIPDANDSLRVENGRPWAYRLQTECQPDEPKCNLNLQRQLLSPSSEEKSVLSWMTTYKPEVILANHSLALLYWAFDGQTYSLMYVSQTQATPTVLAEFRVPQNQVSPPVWSPDDKWALFSVDNGNGSFLWKINIASRLRTRLTQHPIQESYSQEVDAVWSEDGKQIAFTSDINLINRCGHYFYFGIHNAGNIYTINADGTDLKAITDLKGCPNPIP